MSIFVEPIAHFLVKRTMNRTNEHQWKTRARWVLAGIALISLFMGWRVTQIGFDYDFESFFPENDPETAFYLEFRDQFGSDNDFLIIGIEHEQSVFNPNFLRQVDSYVTELEGLPYVTQVLSPTRIEEPIRMGFTVSKRPLLRWNSPDSIVHQHLLSDSIRIENHSTWKGTFISEDAHSILIQIQHEELLSKAGCDSLATAVGEMINSWHYTTHIAGRAMAQKYYVDVMQREVVLFMGIGLFVLILFLWVAFQNRWGVVIPIVVVLLSGLWTLGIMELTGKSIDVMTIVLPTIIFVVGISDVVHILSRYYEELRFGKAQFEAVSSAFREVGLATFLTTLTTAVGFLTLTTSSVVPIRDFGLYSAAGVAVAYLLAFSLLPAIMILYPAPTVQRKGRGVWWNLQLHRGFRFVLRNPKYIATATLFLTCVAIAGASRIQVDNLLLEDLAEDDPFRQEFTYFENSFSGVRPFELSIQLDEQAKPWDLNVMLILDSMTHYLEQEYGVGSIVSMDRIIAQMNRLNNGDQSSFHKIPQQQSQLDQLVKNSRKGKNINPFELVWNEDANVLRVFGKLPDLGAQHYRTKNQAFYTWFDETFPEAPMSVKITGTAQLIDLNVGSLASDMTRGLSIAFLIVAIIAGIMFRNWSMVLISLLPNVLPLIVIAGIMGWAGIDLKLSTSIIFTIAFGIAVDDTIHFISKLRLQLAKGHSLPIAVKRSFLSAGKAIIITSIILCGGFMTLSLSSFLGTFYIGVLISLTLLIAVLSDLFVLPWLILKCLRWSPPSNRSWISKILRP